MKIKIGKNRMIIGLAVFVVLAIVIVVPGSRAKYQVSGSIDIVDGEVSYSFADLNVLAVYIEDESTGDYVSSDTVPTSGYTLSDSSYCTVGDTKDASITIEYSDGLVNFLGVSKKGTKCYLYFNISNSTYICDTNTALSTCLISTASSNGGSDTTLIEHTSGCTNDCAEDGKYRYSGGGTSSSISVNNYICFGTSSLSTCLADTDTYLFRIIEVDPDDGYVKIIKNTKLAGDSSYSSYKSSSNNSYYWNGTDGTSSTAVYYGSYYNYWAIGNTLYATLATDLNTTYLNTLSSSWQNLIATYNWNIAGSGTYSESVKTRYDTETSETASFKIGLINTYDYGYAAESSYWTTSGGVYNYSNEAYLYDWLYLGNYEWTVARRSISSYLAYSVTSTGNVDAYDGFSSTILVRPSFYLEPTAQYISGSGTSSDPILIQ